MSYFAGTYNKLLSINYLPVTGTA